MVRRLSWSKFNWDAWENDPALGMCSMAAQGFWMRVLCLCAKADGNLLIGGKKPSPEALAHITRQSVADVEKWLEELGRQGVFSRTRGGVIYSRRMREDAEKGGRSREFGKGSHTQDTEPEREFVETSPLETETETESETEPLKSPADLEVLADEIWSLANSAGRRRSSQTDLRTALRAAVKRGKDPNRIRAGIAAYYASHDASKDDGKYAKGVHGMVQNDRWENHIEATTPMGGPISDEQWTRLVQYWREGSPWSAQHGPAPGQPGCRVPPALLIRSEAEVA